MQESAFIVLDEPTNHLDVSYQYQIMDILKGQDVTVFSSIHDLNLAALYCDRIIFLYQGKIVDYGTPEEVLTRENIREYFGIEAQVSTNPATGKQQIYYLPGWIKKVDKAKRPAYNSFRFLYIKRLGREQVEVGQDRQKAAGG